MKAIRAPAIAAALAAISLIILTTACVDSPQSQSPPPRAEVAAPAPTNTPTPPEPTPTPEPAPEPTAEPTTAPEPAPTTAPEPTAEPASQSAQSGQSQPAPEPTAEPTNTPAPAPSAQTQAATGDPADIFQNALTAMNALSSYRAEMERVEIGGLMGASGEIMVEVQADVRPPDAMGGDSTITLTGEPPIANSFIVIGNEAYITLPASDNSQNQLWVQSAPSDVEAITTFLTWFETGSQYEFTPAELVGTEDLNGEETHRLRGSFVVKNLPAGTEQPDNMETDVWIGTSDSLIRKIAGSGGVEEIGLELAITISYSRFNDAAIQIEAPTDFISP